MQAVKVAGLFIKSGVIVMSKSTEGKEEFFRDVDPAVLYSGPLIILTSKATASAAEIVAQALKDYGAAIIVGDEQTYGKGSIQMQTITAETNDAACDAAFKVTVGRYYSVSGESAQMSGVTADIVVPSILFHTKLGEQYLDFPLTKDSAPEAFKDSLIDVKPEMKKWYVKCYLPYLQQRKEVYRKWIDELQRKSHERLVANDDYQRFLHGLPLYETKKVEGKEGADTTEKVELSEKQVQKRIWDLQLQEAVHIARDLDELSTK